MNPPEELSLNLGNIKTQWSMVRRAHQNDGSLTGSIDPGTARQQLVMRYASAIRKFVRVVVGDDNLADELSQDAIMRLLKGDFSGADPDRGRFRDLLKTAIRNMARNHWAKENIRTAVDLEPDLVGTDDDLEELDQQWIKQCRDAALEQAWDRLKQFEQATEGNLSFTVLNLRSRNPDADSKQLAELVAEQTGKPIRPDSVRQQIRRARLRFAEYLVEDISAGLADPSPDNIRDELIALGIYSSVKDLLPESS